MAARQLVLQSVNNLIKLVQVVVGTDGGEGGDWTIVVLEDMRETEKGILALITTKFQSLLYTSPNISFSCVLNGYLNHQRSTHTNMNYIFMLPSFLRNVPIAAFLSMLQLLSSSKFANQWNKSQDYSGFFWEQGYLQLVVFVAFCAHFGGQPTQFAQLFLIHYYLRGLVFFLLSNGNPALKSLMRKI